MKTTTIAAVALFVASLAWADATVEQKTQFHLAGPLGGVINAFSRTAREGVTSTTMIHGNKKLMRAGDLGELVDLDQEKIYTIDFGRQSYTVKTFDELRREFQDQQERATRNESKDTKASKKEGPEYEVDFDVKSTGRKETINGFNTHEEIATVTVHEKGKPIEKSGGWILTSDMWMGPRVPAMRELADFERRFAEKVYGPQFVAETRTLAAAFAATPAFGKAMKTFSEKRSSFEGTPIRTNMKFETVAGSEQPKDQQAKSDDSQPSSAGAAMLGGLMNRMKQRKQEKSADSAEKPVPGRAELFTSTTELHSAKSSASAADVAIPAGFRQR